MTFRKIAIIALTVAVATGALAAATPLGRDLLFHVVPIRWTGEADRLVGAVQLAPGDTVADIGGGDGRLIAELAAIVGSSGRAYATERSEEKRRRIAATARAADVAVTLVEAGEQNTGLPDACCDVITMRMVLHHVTNHVAFAADLRRSLRAGGRLAIIDFKPGALPHLADDHGIDPNSVTDVMQKAGLDLTSRDERWGGGNYLLIFRAR